MPILLLLFLLDGNILTNRITNGDAWGVGLMAMTDKTADGILTSNYIAFLLHIRRHWMKTAGIRLESAFRDLMQIKDSMEPDLNFEDQLDQQGGWTLPS